MELKLTKNEKFVLKELIDDGRISDTSIAKKLKISTQAVRKIRKKLESDRIITRYSTIIDYEKLGIKAFAIVQIRADDKIKTDLFESPNIIGSFRLQESNITNILIAGFGSLEELDNYFVKIKKKHPVEIQKINIFSNSGFMKHSPVELLKNKIGSI